MIWIFVAIILVVMAILVDCCVSVIVYHVLRSVNALAKGLSKYRTVGPCFPEGKEAWPYSHGSGHIHFLEEENRVDVFKWDVMDQSWVFIDSIKYLNGYKPSELASPLLKPDLQVWSNIT